MSADMSLLLEATIGAGPLSQRERTDTIPPAGSKLESLASNRGASPAGLITGPSTFGGKVMAIPTEESQKVLAAVLVDGLPKNWSVRSCSADRLSASSISSRHSTCIFLSIGRGIDGGAGPAAGPLSGAGVTHRGDAAGHSSNFGSSGRHCRVFARDRHNVGRKCAAEGGAHFTVGTEAEAESRRRFAAADGDSVCDDADRGLGTLGGVATLVNDTGKLHWLDPSAALAFLGDDPVEGPFSFCCQAVIVDANQVSNSEDNGSLILSCE